MQDEINVEKIINHWIETSENDYKTMINLFRSKDYHWSLFLGHMVIERLLKACIVKEKQAHAPFSHDLQYLARIAKIELSQDHADWIDMISTFNLNARYDSYKQEFYNKCTPEFTKEWLHKIEEIRQWIKQTQLK